MIWAREQAKEVEIVRDRLIQVSDSVPGDGRNYRRRRLGHRVVFHGIYGLGHRAFSDGANEGLVPMFASPGEVLFVDED